MALGARERSTEGAARQMRAVRPHANGRRQHVTERVERRRRLVAAAVTCAAIPRRSLNLTVDVQLRSHEVALGVDYVAMTHATALRLRVRQRRRQAVARAASRVARARLGPHRIGVVAMAIAVDAGAPDGVIRRLSAVRCARRRRTPTRQGGRYLRGPANPRARARRGTRRTRSRRESRSD